MRHLLRFLVLGCLLFLGKRGLAARELELRELTVVVSAAATEREMERAVDQEILLEQALGAKTMVRDPVVREQLLRAVRLSAAESATEDALVARALSLGIHRVDPLVRERLIFQARQVLRASLTVSEPSEAKLGQYLAAHPERYRLPAQLSFRQIFLSRSQRGQTLTRDALRLGKRLEGANPNLLDLPALSDPTLLPFAMRAASEREVDARFGAGFAAAVKSAQGQSVVGPIASSYGLHFVFVDEHLPARMPALGEVKARARADYLHDAQERALSEALVALRKKFRIRIARSQP